MILRHKLELRLLTKCSLVHASCRAGQKACALLCQTVMLLCVFIAIWHAPFHKLPKEAALYSRKWP